jgi:predicted AlkP superfamily phosphohydrolase/phosphomutase
VIVIGLDAAEATLIDRWAGDGHLATFAGLEARGSVSRLGNPLETLPGAVWPELTSGRSCGKVPLYFHPRQLRSGEARVRPVTAAEVDPRDYYWSHASRAGRRVAVVDQPQTVRMPGLNGIQLFEWGAHDRHFLTSSDPPALLDDLRSRHGDHPIRSCDRHGRTRAGYNRLLADLLDAVERKSGLLLELLQRERWDLFACAYSEPHCVGHQFWHFLDPRHPAHDPSAPDHLRHAIRAVYERIDAGIGALIRAAGPDAIVLVVASHGMGLNTGGPQLLPEILVRLGLGSGGITSFAAGVRRWQTAVSHLPRPVQPLLRRIASSSLAKRVQGPTGCLLDPLESPRTRAVTLSNNRCGAIRLNLKGREPFGAVEPGGEAADVLAEIRRELLALRDPASGEPIVTRVVTARDAFGPDHHPDLPDLLVVFRDDLGPLQACASERLGIVEVPNFHPNIPRSGNHTTHSRLWAVGPGVAPGPAPEGNVLDVPPTILRLLDVPLPPGLDGRPLPWLTGAPTLRAE